MTCDVCQLPVTADNPLVNACPACGRSACQACGLDDGQVCSICEEEINA